MARSSFIHLTWPKRWRRKVIPNSWGIKGKVWPVLWNSYIRALFKADYRWENNLNLPTNPNQNPPKNPDPNNTPAATNLWKKANPVNLSTAPSNQPTGNDLFASTAKKWSRRRKEGRKIIWNKHLIIYQVEEIVNLDIFNAFKLPENWWKMDGFFFLL